MGNSHGGGIARPRRLGSANAAAAETESGEKEEDPGSSYEAMCSADPELRTFDAVASGVEVRSLSLSSLRDVTGCLLEMNQEVVRVVLASKRDVWRSPDLSDLVDAFFDGTLHTLDFLAALDASLRRARDAQLPLHLALQHHHRRRRGDELLAELRRFKAAAAGEPLFTAEFFAVFRAVYARQLAMVARLRQRKRQLDGRIQAVRAWRRVSGVVFVATFASLLVCSVVAAAIAAPPVAAALAAAASLPVGSVGKWVDSLLKRYQEALHGYKEVVGAMQVGAFIAIEDLDNIRVLVDRLEVQLGSVVDCIEFAERDEEAVRISIEEVKMKLEMFMKGVDDLGEKADKCSRDVRRARTVVLQRIIHPPS